MDITLLFQAIAISIFCYLGALSTPWLLGLTGGWYTITRPLVSGMIVGLILGDMKQGIIMGVAIQTVYIAMVTPGGQMPADLNFVAFPAIAPCDAFEYEHGSCSNISDNDRDSWDDRFQYVSSSQFILESSGSCCYS